MFLRLHSLYLRFSPLLQLVVLFVLNGVFWYVAWSFYTSYFHEPQRTFFGRVLHAAWMSLIITIPLNLKKLKLIFKKPGHE